MNPNFTAFEELIKSANITPEEKEALIRIFSRAPEEKLKEVIELFTQNPEWISKISQNLMAKEKAFSADDPKTWAEVVDAEKKELEGLEKGK